VFINGRCDIIFDQFHPNSKKYYVHPLKKKDLYVFFAAAIPDVALIFLNYKIRT